MILEKRYLRKAFTDGLHNFLGIVHIFLCMWEVGKPEERGRGRDKGVRIRE